MARVEIDSPRPTEGAFVRYAGLACCWSGLAGLAAAVALIMVTPAVGEDRFNYPLHPTAFVAVQVLFFLQHVLLISGQLSLSRSGALGSSKAGQVGIKIAIVGTAALALSELWAISAADAAYPSRQTSIIESSFGVESLLIGVGFVLAGTRLACWRLGWLASGGPLGVGRVRLRRACPRPGSGVVRPRASRHRFLDAALRVARLAVVAIRARSSSILTATAPGSL